MALISSGLGHVRRGIETWIGELARKLSPQMEVELWGGASLTGWPCPTVALPVIRRSSFWLRRCSWSRRYHFEQMSAVLAAVAKLRRRKIDLAFCGDPSLAWNLKRFRGFHGAKVVFSDGMRLSARWLQEFDGVHLLAPAYLQEAATVVEPANLSRFFVIPYFVELDLFRPPSPDEGRLIRARLGIPAEARVVLTVGPVGTASGKRLDHVAREISRCNRPWLLVSVGGDEDGAESVRTESEACLGPNVRFLGGIPRVDLAEVYRMADCYILGALAEPFSIAILEALASGLPIVHHPDPVTTWVSGGGGCPVSMEKPGVAAEMLDRLASQPELRERLGRAGRALVMERNSPEVVSGGLAARFRALCPQIRELP